MRDLRNNRRNDMRDLRNDIRDDIRDLRNDMRDLRNDMRDIMRAEILPDLKQVLSSPSDIADFRLL
jgi:hypothetical protein